MVRHLSRMLLQACHAPFPSSRSSLNSVWINKSFFVLLLFEFFLFPVPHFSDDVIIERLDVTDGAVLSDGIHYRRRVVDGPTEPVSTAVFSSGMKVYLHSDEPPGILFSSSFSEKK